MINNQYKPCSEIRLQLTEDKEVLLFSGSLTWCFISLKMWLL